MATSYADKLKERAKLDAEIKQMAADEMKRLRDIHRAALESSGFTFEEVWAEELGSKQTKPAAEKGKSGSSAPRVPSKVFVDKAGKEYFYTVGTPGWLKANGWLGADGKVDKKKADRDFDATKDAKGYEAYKAANAKK